MPARITRSSLSVPAAKGPRKKNKSQKRSLNAFAIAEAQEPETHKIRRSRLGEVEEDGSRAKRRRISGDDAENEDEEPVMKQRGRDDDDSSDESDEEGNRWRMGVVGEDDDSDIDSEEAFGSSDEERFEEWTFRGGSGSSKSKGKAMRQTGRDEEGEELDLDENVEEDSGDESLGSDAVDLATMLDNYQGSEDEELSSDSDDGEDGGDDSDDETSPSDYSMSDAQDENDADKAARLQSLVSSLHPEEKASRKPREADSHESRVPSASGLTSSEKFDINDFLATTSDPQLKKVSKELGVLPKTSKKDVKLAPSLPKRQKDRLERIAANEKAKETLERWVDTVKQQRRADHLSFPLFDPETAKPEGSAQMLSVMQSRPFSDLEATIQNIMQESGLTSGRTDEEEEKLRELEELKTNKMPLEEVQARRAELRKARDLLFREEVRAKRIKKIKSKAFRRIKRKERENVAALDRDAFAEGMDGEMDDEEREMAERRRAEERMRLKHKDSKWAKQMKKSGRTTWDEDAISSVTEMARKNDELKRRIEGKEIRDDDDASGDEILSSSDDDGSASDADDDAAEFQRLQRQMQRAEEYGDVDEKASKLHGLKFMREAEARRRKENHEAAEQIRRELNHDVDGSDGEEEEQTVGRRIFAPNLHQDRPAQKTKEMKDEFEEYESDADNDARVIAGGAASVSGDSLSHANGSTTNASLAQITSKVTEAAALPTHNKKSGVVKPSKKPPKHQPTLDPPLEFLPGEKHSQPDADGWVTVTYNQDNGESGAEEEEEKDRPGYSKNILDQTEILRRAFAGDDVEDAFEAEKNTIIEEEDEKVIDSTLPGWGSWIGSGLSKKDKRRKPPHLNQLKKQEGIRPDKRKDAKLQGVIINQKRIKGNAKYLASELPHLYGSRQEYERSIRMPVGGQWNTKATYQENVRPRVMVKPGAIVRPIEKPLV
jgi:U3 small nucleolar RNA-associated protein 14